MPTGATHHSLFLDADDLESLSGEKSRCHDPAATDAHDDHVRLIVPLCRGLYGGNGTGVGKIGAGNALYQARCDSVELLVPRGRQCFRVICDGLRFAAASERCGPHSQGTCRKSAAKEVAARERTRRVVRRAVLAVFTFHSTLLLRRCRMPLLPTNPSASGYDPPRLSRGFDLPRVYARREAGGDA